MNYQPTPRELAVYDQAHAAVSVALDEAIAAYREALPEDGPGVALVGLAAYHVQRVDPETVASMLAVAVSRLARRTDRP